MIDESVSLEVSNAHDDDYVNHHSRVKASNKTHTVVWHIPDRLLNNNEQFFEYVMQELVSELHERTQLYLRNKDWYDRFLSLKR